MGKKLGRSLLTPTLSVIFSLALPSLGWSNVVRVQCEGGTKGGDYSSITDALAALDRFGPHQIHVSGTCTERVLIVERERVTITGVPPFAEIVGPQPGSDVIVVRESHNVVLQQLTIRGGALGINLNANAEVDVFTSTLRNNGVGAETAGPRPGIRCF